MELIRPRLRLLTLEQRNQIHDYSLELLATVGIRVDSKQARELFRKVVGDRVQDRKVRIPPDLVSWALDIAPSTIDIYHRDGELAFTLAGDSHNGTRFGIGVTNLYYQDPLTDAVEPFQRKHVAIASRLGTALENFDLVSTPGVCQDLPPDRADLVATLELTANTSKPVVLLVSESHYFEFTLDLLEHLYGDLATHPFVIPYVNPITPLVLNPETVDKSMAAIRRGLPLIYSNYGMSGATTPITAAGTLVVMNAELLAGLVFTQLVKPGTPVILGSLPVGFDMKAMISLYTPQTTLLNLACAEMMAHYRLPHCGTSGSGPGWGPDLLASGGFWLNHLTACLNKVGIAPFVGGNFDSLVFSPAAVIYADQVIREARLFRSGFELQPELVAMDQIASVGHGGNFLITELTLSRFREAQSRCEFWPVLTLDQWKKRDCPKADDLFRKYASDFIAQLESPADYDEIIQRGEAFLDTIRKKEHR